MIRSSIIDIGQGIQLRPGENVHRKGTAVVTGRRLTHCVGT